MQTFGIEIEMNHINRSAAAEIVADHYGTLNSVHYVGGGYSAYECKDRYGRTWKFMTDASISGGRPIIAAAGCNALHRLSPEKAHKNKSALPARGCRTLKNNS